jgi:serine/threonine-protein kinase
VTAFLSHEERIALLANAARLARSVTHRTLPALRAVMATAWGPMLIYDWAPGELVRAPPDRRDDAGSAFQRFCRLPPDELAAALGAILEAHVKLCGAGWVACDFYDGAIIYDFTARRIWLVDLDSYHLGPFANDMGRMFGSTRFMAPEEFARGATIDERTTVFTLGRAMAVFMGDGGLGRSEFRGGEREYRAMIRACALDPTERFQTVAALAQAWRS